LQRFLKCNAALCGALRRFAALFGVCLFKIQQTGQPRIARIDTDKPNRKN